MKTIFAKDLIVEELEKIQHQAHKDMQKTNNSNCNPNCNPNCDPCCCPVCSPSCSPCFPYGKCNPDLGF